MTSANHAESGETIRSFETEKRWEKIFSTIQAGDYLMLQFPNVDAAAHMTSANNAIALAQKDVTTAFARHKAASK